MIEILDTINYLFNKKFQIYKTPIIFEKKVVGYECSLVDDLGDTLSSGTNSDYNLSLRICLAEAIERGCAKKIANDPKLTSEFLINNYPTTCGFAAGFEKNKTKLRAIAEGIERWAWSKWIDDLCGLDEIGFNNILVGKLEEKLFHQFDEYRLFKKQINFNISGEKLDLIFVVFIGFTPIGAFPGSRVYINQKNLNFDFNHSIVEASRILNNIKKSKNIKNLDIIGKRAFYFGSNKAAAINAIERAQKNQIEWQMPQLQILKQYEFSKNIFLFRCLMKDYIPWHLGDEKRFVY